MGSSCWHVEKEDDGGGKKGNGGSTFPRLRGSLQRIDRSTNNPLFEGVGMGRWLTVRVKESGGEAAGGRRRGENGGGGVVKSIGQYLSRGSDGSPRCTGRKHEQSSC